MHISAKDSICHVVNAQGMAATCFPVAGSGGSAATLLLSPY